jgi:hypothetical protein
LEILCCEHQFHLHFQLCLLVALAPLVPVGMATALLESLIGPLLEVLSLVDQVLLHHLLPSAASLDSIVPSQCLLVDLVEFNDPKFR